MPNYVLKMLISAGDLNPRNTRFLEPTQIHISIGSGVLPDTQTHIETDHETSATIGRN